MTGVPEMPAHEDDADDVADDRSRRRAFDAPSEPLDEHDVKTEIDGIVNEDGNRDQSRTAVHPNHRSQCPRHHISRRTEQQRVEIVARSPEELLAVAQPARDGVGEEQAADRLQQAKGQTADGGQGEDVGGTVKVLLAEFHAHEHACSR